jgi:hypothetical protein
MKRGFYSIAAIVLLCGFAMSGCIKHMTGDLTVNPYVTATVNGVDTFTSATVVPSVVNNQVADTGSIFIITADANLLQNSPGDQIILTINHYKNVSATLSLVQGQVSEIYVHNGIPHIGTGGIVSISHVNASTISGYFSFVTADGISITNGLFNVAKP